ncbi:MAG: hypothetical protein JST93_03730 [Acidobacteria bacterium]|nr:hypothetical protein [Acidobacteriota bacterium]
MQTLNGKFHYRSYCPAAGTATNPSSIAAPWAPPGQLTATTDASGAISGTLEFAPAVKLEVKGVVTPAANGSPEGVDLTAEGLGATYLVRGYFGANGSIAGCVLAVKGDLGKQPAGTLGSFLLTHG